MPDEELDMHPAGDDRDLREAMTAAGKGDWRPARDLLVAAQDWDTKAARVSALALTTTVSEEYNLDPRADHFSPANWVEDWLRTQLGNPNAIAVLARTFINRAWAHRRDGRPIGQLLERAEELAREAARIAPHDPTSYSTLVQLATARQLPKDAFWKRMGDVLRVDRWHLEAHELGLLYLCEKWYGSHPEMYDFARKTAKSAPEGSALHCLPVEAHCEWEYHTLVTARGLKTRRATKRIAEKWRSADVNADLDNAMSQWIWADECPGPTPYRALNILGYALLQANRLPEASTIFDAIGTHYRAAPWIWVDPDDPIGAFREARNRALT